MMNTIQNVMALCLIRNKAESGQYLCRMQQRQLAQENQMSSFSWEQHSYRYCHAPIHKCFGTLHVYTMVQQKSTRFKAQVLVPTHTHKIL